MSSQPPSDGFDAASWEQMGLGAPMIVGLARLCGNALARGVASDDAIGDAARALLHLARERGIFEIKANNTAFESPNRLLTVYVELDAERWVRFRNAEDPRLAIRFFEGFRQLCAGGLVMHHLYREFSLTEAGFEAAARVDADEVRPLLELGTACGIGG